MPGFKFELGDDVLFLVSDERGKVIGRAEYTGHENSYYLHYQSADGRARTDWFDESMLEAFAK